MGSYFEGWYFKHQKGPDTLAIIVGRAEDGAFIQVITQEGSYRLRYPISAYHKGKTIKLGDSWFAWDEICLSVCHKDLRISGYLQYDHLTPICGDIMGPFRFLPMQCRHTVISMDHGVTGEICLNGRKIDFTGGKGYIEGDAGRSFPKSYTWVQCNDFAENCSIMASVAHIPFAGSWFWGCICVVWLDGVEYRLATYRGAKIKYRDERQLLIEQKDLSLKIFFLQPHSGYELDAPHRGEMRRSIREVPSAPAYFEFRRGNQVLFQGESPFADYEHVF
ncbi:MAG: tocopherol cyclase family protein [Bacillota bacterium]